MLRIEGITSETHQIHTVLLGDYEVEVTLRFFPRAQMWTVTAVYRDDRRSNFKLSVGTLHMTSSNLPFDFAVTDTSGAGIDPFKADDFAEGRCWLLLLEPADMEVVRGAPVPI